MFSVFFHLNVSVQAQIAGLVEIARMKAHSLGGVTNGGMLRLVELGAWFSP